MDVPFSIALQISNLSQHIARNIIKSEKLITRRNLIGSGDGHKLINLISTLDPL